MTSVIPVELRLSAYQIGSRASPRYVWAVGVNRDFMQTIPDTMQRAKLRQHSGQVFLDLSDEGIKLASGNGRFTYANQIGQHHVSGLRSPDETVKSIPLEGEFNPNERTIKFTGKLPEVIERAMIDEEPIERAMDPKIHFPATHFQEDIQNAIEEDVEQWLDSKIEQAQNQVIAEAVALTPALAQELLNRNAGNRPLRAAKLNQYVNDIMNDRWELNGETIIISKDGMVNNGQHRCSAVVQTGKTIDTLLVFGVTRESRRTVDTGASRGAHDHLSVEGFTQPTTLAAATRFVLTYENNEGRGFAQLNRITSSEIFERATHDAMLDAASLYPYRHASKAKRLAPPSVLSFCYYIFSKKDPQDADKFLDQVVTGLGLSADMPAYVTREKLLELSSLLREQKIEVLIRGWNAFRRRKPLKAIRIKWELPEVL